ncbi:MAG TPA: glycogen synthase GlgA [Verrucomicrobiae bacterium]|nr:glycogen synthase GlgA [Verrucomicrobiae bacterium]
MRILLASSEVYPYSKTGGLADMIGALAKALGRAGHQVGIVTPLYGSIRARFPDLQKFDWHIDLPLGTDRVVADVWTREHSKNVQVYFLNQPQFYDRSGIYNEGGVDYPDNGQRYIFFAKAVVHLARYLPWAPEVIHVHDWQVGLVPILALHHRLTQGWPNPPRTCYTIHNLAYQGVFPRPYYDLTNLPIDYFNPNGIEFYGYMNCMKAGIMYADTLTTVSPRYAREIMTEEFGCGLDDRLRQRQDALFGILNGVDYEEWNTENNPHLKHRYSATNLAGKPSNKLDLQLEVGLPKNPRVPLFGSITRLVDQKGVDITLGALEEMLSSDMQFVMLGSGSPVYEKAFTQLAARHPKKVAVSIGYDHGLSHRIEAGSDFFLMPSRYEPSGLNQMYSLRYGTIPIVRTTGGLDDSVTDISEDLERANGIKFTDYSVRAMARAIRKALVLYEKPELMEHYRKNGMASDFSWEKTAKEYVKAYRA